ncbi:MAG: hypothetical protein HYY14_06605 [Candidatus Omnitrophica bacterium]|nr:hypothetical protein [Candidatus Omnitrophota bacterium]
MKYVKGLLLITALVFWGVGAQAAEHGGQEHAGQEHAGEEHGAAAVTAAETPAAPALEPTADQIRQAIQEYIADVEEVEGAFTIEDEVTGNLRTLTLERVHERVGKTGDLFYSCTDMKDTETSEVLDLDFDVESSEGELFVIDTRIHKVSDKPRYTYDANDNRIPL